MMKLIAKITLIAILLSSVSLYAQNTDTNTKWETKYEARETRRSARREARETRRKSYNEYIFELATFDEETTAKNLDGKRNTRIENRHEFWSGLFGRSPSIQDCRTQAKGNVDYIDLAILTNGMKYGYGAEEIKTLFMGKSFDEEK